MHRVKSAYPRVVGRKAVFSSPWVTLIEKTVQFSQDEPAEAYYCLTQADYVAVLAVTESGRVPLVRQYRPAVESFTWELPAGTVDAGETPEQAARRELREETGLTAAEAVDLGRFLPDTGRLDVRSCAFFVRASGTPEALTEHRLDVRYVTPAELLDMVRSGEFQHQIHLAVLASAMLSPACPEFRP